MSTHKNGKSMLTKEYIFKKLSLHSIQLQKYQVKKIGLFGSYAKGKPHKNSDIDLLIEFKEPSFDSFMELSFYLEKLFGRRIDILTPVGVESIRIKKIMSDIRRSVVYG